MNLSLPAKSQPSQPPAIVNAPSPSGKPGFSNQDISYRIYLSKCQTADDFLALLDKCKHEFTPQTVDIIRAHILACTSPEVVLTNFPTAKDIEIFLIDQDILARKSKCAVPRIDSNKPLFHYFFSYIMYISVPRSLRSLRGFDRDKQNEERIHSEVESKFKQPENKKPADIFSR